MGPQVAVYISFGGINMGTFIIMVVLGGALLYDKIKRYQVEQHIKRLNAMRDWMMNKDNRNE